MASETPRWQLAALGVLAVLAVVLAVTIWPRGTADITGNGPDRPRDPAVARADDPAVPPSLGLDQMSSEQVAPANRRDLFRFGSAAPAPSGGNGQDDGGAAPVQRAPRAAPGGLAQPAVPVEPGPPVEAPIPLRYVGYAETPGSGKVAALSDGRFTYHGREGDVIEGRWRVVQIGVESLVVERVDGTGRQTLRLAGG
ncbi:MAG: hypothetical protein M3Q55_04580 [Acidobacteriota bacterium]|nr:hypothetical protein [Acidobacteriota bacterium]